MILVIIAVLILFCGTTHVTGIDTVGGNSATEWQLVKAFSSGGLQYIVPSDDSGPTDPNDPAANAKAEEKRVKGVVAKYRVNTGASTPCPT